MNARQRGTLEAVFREPTPANIRWNAIESLIKALGGVVDRGREGSRVGLYLRGKAAVLHRPHPTPETPRPTVRAVRELLVKAGVTPTD